jgi:hypothetical protein
MKRTLQFLALFLVLGLPGRALPGCFGGPGVEPPFSAETGGNAPPGSDNSYSVPTGGGEGEKAVDGRGGEAGPEAQGEPAADVDGNGSGYVPPAVTGDGGVPLDGGDDLGFSEDAGDTGDAGDAGRVQDELFFE